MSDKIDEIIDRNWIEPLPTVKTWRQTTAAACREVESWARADEAAKYQLLVDTLRKTIRLFGERNSDKIQDEIRSSERNKMALEAIDALAAPGVGWAQVADVLLTLAKPAPSKKPEWCEHCQWIEEDAASSAHFGRVLTGSIVTTRHNSEWIPDNHLFCPVCGTPRPASQP